MNLRAGVPPRVPVGERRDGLEGRQRPRYGIQAIARDAAALFIRKVDDVLAGMEAEVAGAKVPAHGELPRRIGRQAAGGGIEPELINHVGPRRVPGRF